MTHESFSFGEEEYFLCKAMDGTSTSEEILNRFYRHFGAEMTEEHFRSFEEHLLAMGLAEMTEAVPEPAAKIGDPSAVAIRMGPVAARKKGPILYAGKSAIPRRFFPPPTVSSALSMCFSGFSSLGLIPALPMALYVIFRHDTEFRLDLRTLGAQIGYLGGLLFGLGFANFMRCIVQGVVCAHYQVAPQAFGIKLRCGVVPRFYIDKAKVRQLVAPRSSGSLAWHSCCAFSSSSGEPCFGCFLRMPAI